MTPIAAIAFDFGGTLFSTAKMGHFDAEMKSTFIEHAQTEDQCSKEEAESIFDRYIENWNSRRARAGTLPEAEISSADLLRAALDQSNVQLSELQILNILNAFHGKESELFQPFDGATETLHQLAESGYLLSIVSNNPWAESILASLRRHDCRDLFEHVIVSCDVGYRKPHRPIFDVLVAKLKRPPSEILFVGDSYAHDIATPKLMGMRTCLADIEGHNKNNQDRYAHRADVFLRDFRKLPSALDNLT